MPHTRAAGVREALTPEERRGWIDGLTGKLEPGRADNAIISVAAAVIAGLSQVAAALRINCWSISPMAALIGTQLLEEGTAARIIEAQKQELRQRQTALTEILGAFDVQTHPTSTHAWLRLPDFNRSRVVCFVRFAGSLPLTVAAARVPHLIR